MPTLTVVSSALLAVVVLLSVADAAAATETQSAPECGLKRFASVPLTIAGDDLLLVPVTINSTRALVILDTANTGQYLWRGALDRLDVRERGLPLKYRGVAYEQRLTGYAAPKTVSIGGQLHFDGTEFLVISKRRNNPVPATDVPIVGIIGMPFFGGLDIELDMAHRLLNLYSPEHCASNVVYWADRYDAIALRRGKRGNPYFIMELDGRKIETELSTGSRATTVDARIWVDRVVRGGATSPRRVLGSPYTGQIGGSYRAMELSTDGLNVMNTEVRWRFQDDDCEPALLLRPEDVARFENCDGVYPLVLGMNVIKTLHLYIAAKENVLYFTLADVGSLEGTRKGP